MNSTVSSIWIIGCGDIGRRILKHYVSTDVRPTALVHSRSSITACQPLAGRVVQTDLDREDQVASLNLVDASVIYLAPPPRQGTTDPRIRRLLDTHGSAMRRIILISTTGVYGDCAGEWINEQTPTVPNTERGKRRLDAENSVRHWAATRGGEFIILRVPGIYAEDRLPESRLRQGLPVVREDQAAYTNRIHAEDLARICIAALDSSRTGLVLNATDGKPTTMTEYFNRVADALKIDRPPQISLAEAAEQLSAGMLSYANESRKIDNRALIDELSITLDYPDIEFTLSRLAKVRR